ncbi:SLAP domain-containing protein [Lactobacillus amylovorus]|uniref:SLAP domain-containing protein n=1 Tax=Lactobacillus amylovorus TaxID=1604 RepID=A0AAW6BBT7_LACAM|nr:SLAP domain-containing protein [Lactobacillus amylovorus]MDA6090335.1 SLAP domain-containing protein [Lactobacillus amylovorus]MDB6247656.1 SLAP domain-containing protein [Lactobacillus amylovorus]UIK35277.1 SLAP domain-containing protein [Lactobacillus amylovorus]
MKKNLRIVSIAAAALLAVAPVAASAVSTVSAADATTTTTATTTTNKPTVDLTGAGAVTNADKTVTVTPNFTLTAAVAKDKNVIASATLQGTITASLNGTSVTANVIDAAKDVTLKSNTGYTTIYKYDGKTIENNLGKWNEAAGDVYVKAGNDYQVELTGVGFSFGSANANKEVSLKLPANVTVTDAAGTPFKDNKVKLDQYGNVTNLTFTVKGIKAYDATNTSAVQFYNTNSGLIESKATYITLADNDGNLNVNTLFDGLKKQYKAVQLQNGELKDVNVTTTAADLTAELEKAGIKVNAAGDFEAPASFTATLTAKSTVNGKVATLPVTVTVPNGKVVPSQSKTIMHNAYFYDKDAKRVGTDKVTRYNTVTVATSTTTINGKAYYEVVENGKATGKFINADNIDGTKRTLKHNAYVYKSSKKRANKVVLKKGTEVTTYGGSYTFKNGKQYYKIGNNTDKTYVKASNF